jgi:flavin-dependent dehydrogenase
MTGEGIGQALLTGVLAAESIEEGALDAPRVVASYDQRVRDALVADHKMSMLLIRALKHRKGARTAVRVAGASDWTRRNFARWLFEDYPRSVITTPRRWKRGMFTGPGAYRTP